MRGWLRAHPLGLILLAVTAVLALAAGLVLPRLDAVEIRGALLVPATEPLPAPDSVVEVRFGYRLASSQRGEVVVRARTARGEVREVVPIVKGRGEHLARLGVEAGVVAIGVELRPSSPPGWFDGLLGSRRRDSAVTEPRPLGP